jgi:hypothetical protein
MEETMNTTSYESDIVAWAHEQAALIRAGRFEYLDLANIAEEIEDVGKSEQREIASRMAVLLMHLLKWEYQPEFRGKSWSATIKTQRKLIIDHLDDVPSLRPKLSESKWLEKVWADARMNASKETRIGFDKFPEICPWSMEQVLQTDWLPTM